MRTETVPLGATLRAREGEVSPGRVVAGRYEVQELLGRGGYGLVYEALDRRSGRVVALKVLRADRWSEVTVRRFRREAELVRHLHHPRLVRVYEAGTDGDDLYLTMERVWGESLGCRMQRGPLPVDEAIEIALQMAEALAVLHGAGMVHRDVKPQNVLLEPRGRVKLADFGLIRCLGTTAAGLTGSSEAVGTAEYMAPEDALGEPLDARSDLYSLGVVLYEMLTGAPPHLGRTPLGTLLAHLQLKAPDVRRARADVPAWLSRVVACLLARRRDDRYASARDLLADLRARRAGAAPRRVSKVRRGIALAAVLALAACALAVHEMRPVTDLRAVQSGSAGLTAVGPQGEVLWRLEGRRGHLVRARLKRGEPERLVGVLEPVSQTEPRTVRELVVLDETTGATVRTVPLVSGAGAFKDFADHYSARVEATDLDGDGLDEVVVSYTHTPYWPSYVVLYEPSLERSRVVFYGSGHHRFAGATDVDGDGRRELILGGINNRLGYVPAVAAVRPVPAVNRAADVRGFLAAGSPDALYQVGKHTLVWYALLPRRASGDLSTSIRIEETGRTIEVATRVGADLALGFDGFPVGTRSEVPALARRKARVEGYRHLREARRLTAAGFRDPAVDEVTAAVAAVEGMDDPILSEHLRRAEGQILVAAGRFDEAETLFTRVASASDEAPEVSFDAARAFHLAGRLERAIVWYHRGLGPGGMSEMGRGKWEFLEGLVFALDELGRLDEAAAEVERFASAWRAETGIVDRDSVKVFRDYLRWRRGEPPVEAWRLSRNGQPDVFRYLILEMALARGSDPAALLPTVDEELARSSDVLPMLRSLRAVLLERLGRLDEAVAAGRRAVEELAHRVDDEVYEQTFRDLVEARAAQAVRSRQAAEDVRGP